MADLRRTGPQAIDANSQPYPSISPEHVIFKKSGYAKRISTLNKFCEQKSGQVK